MCGKRLKVFLLLSVLSLLSLPVRFSLYSYADVTLTDREAQELMNEIQQSKKELQTVKDELSESKKDLTELETQLQDVKNTYSEQKTSYEMQLTEAKKKNQKLKVAVSVTGGTSVALLIVTALLIIL